MNKKKIILKTVVVVLVVGLLIYVILSAVEYFRPKYVTVRIGFSDEPYTPELALSGWNCYDFTNGQRGIDVIEISIPYDGKARRVGIVAYNVYYLDEEIVPHKNWVLYESDDNYFSKSSDYTGPDGEYETAFSRKRCGQILVSLDNTNRNWEPRSMTFMVTVYEPEENEEL